MNSTADALADVWNEYVGGSLSPIDRAVLIDLLLTAMRAEHERCAVFVETMPGYASPGDCASALRRHDTTT